MFSQKQNSMLISLTATSKCQGMNSHQEEDIEILREEGSSFYSRGFYFKTNIFENENVGTISLKLSIAKKSGLSFLLTDP